MSGSFEKLLAFISKFKKLESVNISHCWLAAGMVVQVIAALRTCIATMKEVTLQGVCWNTEEAVEALAQYIAEAPKLEKCDIYDKTSRPRILLRRQKAVEDVKGSVKVIDLETHHVHCSVDTSLTTEIRLLD